MLESAILDFEVGVFEACPTFLVRNPTSRGFPVKNFNQELENSDFLYQLKHTISWPGAGCNELPKMLNYPINLIVQLQYFPFMTVSA